VRGVLVERLILRHFKRFDDVEIHFRDGITGIIGNNGTGKSSIVEAILFALFGVQGTGVASEFVVSSFAGQKGKCEVRLDFQVGGVRYSVTRTFRRGAQVHHEARLHMGERLLATGVSEVAAEIERLCGMGAGDFRNTVYAAQKDLLALLETRPGVRREWFMKALGIERLRDGSDRVLKVWIDAAETAVQREKVRIEALLAQGDVSAIPTLTIEATRIRAELEQKERERKDLAAIQDVLQRKKAATEALQKVQDRVCAADAALAEMQEARSRLKDLQPALSRLETVTGELADQRGREEKSREIENRMGRSEAAIQAGKKRLLDLSEEIEAYQEEEEEFRSLEGVPGLLAQANEREAVLAKAAFIWESLEKLRSQREKTGGDIRQCKGRESDLEEKVRAGLAARQRLADLEGLVQDLQRERAVLESKIAGLARERESVLADWERIRGTGRDGTCPLCHQVLGDHYPYIEEEYRERLSRTGEEHETLTREVTSLSARLASAESERASLVREVEELSRLEQQLRDTRALRGTLEARQAETDKEISRVQASLDEIGVPRYSRSVHEEAKKLVQSFERQYERFCTLNFHRERLSVITREREELLETMEREVEHFQSLKEERDRLGYDPGKKKALEEEFSGLQAARDEALRLQERLSREPSIREERENAARERGRLEKELVSYQAFLEGAGFAGSAAETLPARVESLAGEISRLHVALGSIQEKIALLVRVASELEDARSRLADQEKNLVTLRIARKTVAEYITYLIQVVRADIEDEVSRIISEITAGRYDRVLLDEDFNLFIRDIDGDYPLARYSGGEQDAMAVALRIALSRYLSELHGIKENMFLVFDEIFGSQDEERRANLLQALRSQESHFPQIILISHIPEMQGEFSHTLLVEMGGGPSSRVVEVTE